MWNLDKIKEYIKEGVEEHLHLDYKASDALSKSKDKKQEISKDVSAFANSDGGVIIYGISEDQTNKHLPGEIDPINGNEITKEWLEQVINSTISPRIQNILITPIQVEEKEQNKVIYVVEIPKSNTAHQMNDYRYYRRYNFESIRMSDWEIKDIINRVNKPIINIEIRTNINSNLLARISGHRYELMIIIQNLGNVGANQVECYLEFDSKFRTLINKSIPKNGQEVFQITFTNKVENRIKIGDSEGIISTYYEPLLPQVFREFGTIPVKKELLESDAKILCHVTTEFGATQKEVFIKDTINDLRNGEE